MRLSQVYEAVYRLPAMATLPSEGNFKVSTVESNLDIRHYVADSVSSRRAEHPISGEMVPARLLFVVVLRGPRTGRTRMGIQHRFAS